MREDNAVRQQRCTYSSSTSITSAHAQERRYTCQVSLDSVSSSVVVALSREMTTHNQFETDEW